MMLPFEQVSDIETMTMEEEQRFEQELSEHFLQEEFYFCRPLKSIGMRMYGFWNSSIFLRNG